MMQHFFSYTKKDNSNVQANMLNLSDRSGYNNINYRMGMAFIYVLIGSSNSSLLMRLSHGFIA